MLLRELAQAIVGALQVQNRLFQQARDGSIHPAVLVALFHYAAGKPPAHVQVTAPNTERAELVARLRLLPKEDRLKLAEINLKTRRLAEGRAVDVTLAQAEPAVE